jgi:hypothetical protein
MEILFITYLPPHTWFFCFLFFLTLFFKWRGIGIHNVITTKKYHIHERISQWYQGKYVINTMLWSNNVPLWLLSSCIFPGVTKYFEPGWKLTREVISQCWILRPAVLNLDPGPLRIEPGRGILIINPVQNSTA